MEDTIELNLGDIFAIIKKRLVMIIASAIVLALVALVYSQFIVTPLYTATAVLYIDPNKDNPQEQNSSSANINDLTYAQKIMTTYIQMLSTNVFYKEVLAQTGYDYTIPEMKEMIKLTPVSDTEIFNVSVTTSSAKKSLKLAQVFCDLAPKKIVEIKDVNSLQVIDPATLPDKPSNNHTARNTAIGFILGLMLSMGLAFLLEIMDVSVKGVDDLTKHYELPLLGSIPDFDKIEKKRGGYGYGYGNQAEAED